MARTTAPADQTFIDIAFNGTWRIDTQDGEYLDVVSDDGGAPTLTTHPIHRLRHGFRFTAFEALGDGRWEVWGEPVPLAEDPDGPHGPAPGGYVFPFVLAYDGCDRFVLESLPEGHALRATATAQRTVGAMARLGAGDTFPVDMDAYTFLTTRSGIGFPTFEGDEQRAFTSITMQLGFDPHGPLLTLAALANTTRPDDVPEAAWTAVLTQLRREIHYRELAGAYLGRAESFVQNVFISNSGLVENVGTIVGLDKSDVVQLLLNAAFQSAASAVGGLSAPGAGVVSAALSALFQQLAADRGPSAADFRVALAEARTKVSALFESLITAVQTWRADVFADWGKLETMGRNLESGAVAWPDNDEPMRREAKRQLEISLFKDLVKVRWNHMRPSDDPRFHTTDDWIPGYMEKNKNYWLKAERTTQKGAFGKETEGFTVYTSWLGRGGTIFNHKTPDDRLPIRVFNELGVPRATVFSEWGLEPATFFVNR